jgi:hypothetical protein
MTVHVVPAEQSGAGFAEAAEANGICNGENEPRRRQVTVIALRILTRIEEE